MSQKGLVHVYTGDGKGKTTAALGLALRARSHGLRVCYISFHKNPEKWGYQEHTTLEQIGVDIHRFALKHPACDSDVSPEEVRSQCSDGISFVLSLFEKNGYDMIILDEVLISVREGFLEEKTLLSLMDSKPPCLELILTGRGATEPVIKRADLVSSVQEVKHPYDHGTPARRGIEF